MTGTVTEEILRIPLDSIVPSPGNRRIGGFNPERLEQLADSIRAVGVQQPAVVRPGEDDHVYELVAGERRWRASRLAGLEDLPCVVRELDDLQVLKIQTIENLQREDIHPLDEAEGYQRLIEKADYDVELIAQEVGRSPSYVYQRMKLQELVDEARQALVDGEINAGHAIQIARLQPEQQTMCMEIFDGDRRETPSVRDLSNWIHNEILTDLHSAGFKKDDADLLPDAGPCTECPKRTGYQPELFADICKRDYCTDPDCFHAKLAALVERRRAELKGEKHLEVCDGYVVYEIEQKLPERVSRAHAWQECKKKDDGAQRCLIVAGARIGQLTWGMKPKANRYGMVEKSPEEKAAGKAQRAAEKKRQEKMRRIWDAVMEKIETYFDESGGFPKDLLRLSVRRFFERLWDDHRKRLCGLHGWERPPVEEGQNHWERANWQAVGVGKIEQMSEKRLLMFLAKCALIHTMETSLGHTDGYVSETEADLRQIGGSLGIDVDAIWAEDSEQTA